ncbi:MAG: glycosyltransferase family 39 protein [Bdellovibrionales bacterium]|nr:glycosyltransferase family 39 protein [Bdellovibrionales bacterium]
MKQKDRSQNCEIPTVTSYLMLVLMLVVGVAIRFDFLIASQFVPDSDEAIVGLMAKHITEGHGIPTFYYGQHYMGSFEPLLVSWLFELFGFHPWLLKLVPLTFGVSLIVLMYFIGREVGGNRVALLAATLTALPPATLVVWSLKARGGFIEVVWLGGLLTLFALRFLKSQQFDWARLFGIALVFGFAWWTNNQIVYYAPILACLVVTKAFSCSSGFFSGIATNAKALIFGFFASILGGLPFWVYNLQNDFASFKQLLRAPEGELSEHFSGFFEHSLPILLGAKRYWQTVELVEYSTVLCFVLYGILLLVAAISCFRFGRKDHRWGAFLFLFGVFISGITIFIVSPYGYLSEAPRYLLPVYVPLLLMTAIGIDGVISMAPQVGRFALGFLLVMNFASSYLFQRAIPGEPFVVDGDRVSRDHSELYDWLKSHSVQWIRTNYWIGYRVAYETGEATRFLMFQAPYQVRIEEYEDIGNSLSESEVPYVLVPHQAQVVEDRLKVLGYSYERATASGYVIIFNVRAPDIELLPISPKEFAVEASVANSTIHNAVDGDLQTRWGSGKPQDPSMEIRFSFHVPTEIAAFEYLLGKWVTDFPRRFTVYGITVEGEQVPLITSEQYDSLRFAGIGHSWKAFIHPQPLSVLVLHQEGEDSFFDWSIAEFRIFTQKKDVEAQVPDGD